MTARFGFALVLVALFGATLRAQSQVTINDSFDNYTDAADLQTKWGKIGTGVGGVDLIDPVNNNPYSFPDIQGKAAQYDGATGIGANTAYKWTTPFTLKPDATHVVKLTFDQFVPSTGTANANWKSTVGLRGPGAENLIELGITNSNANFVPYGFRLVNLFPSAQNADFGMTSTGYGAMALPATKNTPMDAEIGGGWHRYEMTISTTTITIKLDLYRDGLTNDDVDTVPGVGVVGVDATNVIAPTSPLSITANGFTDIRFGMLSAVGSSPTVTAFDNIKLELVTVAGPASNADFNGDNIVDGADFLIWQRGFGAAGTLATGDANSDTLVNDADLAIFKTQFGTDPTPVVGAVAAVPEPTTIALAGVAVLGTLASARRRK